MNTHANLLTRTRASRFPVRRSGLVLAVLAALTSAHAQSVQVGGDINPFPATNPQTSWDLGAAELTVGNTGAGTLAIADGGSVVGDGSEDLFDYLKISAIGRTLGSSGEATVTGAGSLWAMSHSLLVGHAGTGSLTIENGGGVTTGIDGVIGFASGSRGTATVTGADSSWTARYNLNVGYEGTGSLTVSNGARIENGHYDAELEINQGDGYIGYSNGSRGHVTVTGAGSSWTNNGDLILGGDSLESAATNASGTLTVEIDGAVNVGGTIKVHAGGTLSVEVSHAPAVTAGGDLSNDGLVRLSAAPRLSAGDYTPLAVTGELTGSGRYQALGGTWNASTRLFTVSEAQAALAGEQATLDLNVTQRLTVTGDNGTVSAAFSADGQAVGGGSAISFTATENTTTVIDGGTVLAAWDFSSTLDMSGGATLIEFTMDFTPENTILPGSIIQFWRSSNGVDFGSYEPTHIRLTEEDAGGLGRSSGSSHSHSITFEVDGFGSYAITLAPIPEPASAAALTGLVALGLVALRRKHCSARATEA
ncbi:MAG: hypothetical protein ABW223_00010 [Rariglobus sp.]